MAKQQLDFLAGPRALARIRDQGLSPDDIRLVCDRLDVHSLTQCYMLSTQILTRIVDDRCIIVK